MTEAIKDPLYEIEQKHGTDPFERRWQTGETAKRIPTSPEATEARIAAAKAANEEAAAEHERIKQALAARNAVDKLDI